MCLKLEHERRHFETNKVSWPHTENHHEKTIFLIIYFRVALDWSNRSPWDEKKRIETWNRERWSARFLGKVKKWQASIINYKLIWRQLFKVRILSMVKMKIGWFSEHDSPSTVCAWLPKMAVSALEPSSTDFLLSINEKPTQRQRKSHEKNSANQKL